MQAVSLSVTGRCSHLFCVTLSPFTFRLLFCTVFFSSCLLHWLHCPSVTLVRTPFLLLGCTNILLCKPKDVFCVCDIIAQNHGQEMWILPLAVFRTYTHGNFETVVCTALLQCCLVWTIFACFCSLCVVKMKDLNYWQSTFSHFRGDVGSKTLSSIL